MEYYIASGQQRLGPFMLEQLATQGLLPDTLVWCEGMPQWSPASTVQELIPLLPMQQPGALSPIAYQSPGYASAQPFDAGQQSDPNAPITYATPGGTMMQPFVPGQSNRTIAGVFGILMGALGVHKFIAGLTTGGTIMLCVTLGSFVFSSFCCFAIFVPITMGIIGFIEGIMYLTCTDEEFHYRYVVEKRQWF